MLGQLEGSLAIAQSQRSMGALLCRKQLIKCMTVSWESLRSRTSKRSPSRTRGKVSRARGRYQTVHWLRLGTATRGTHWRQVHKPGGTIIAFLRFTSPKARMLLALSLGLLV